MPTPLDAMLALVVIAIGLQMVVTAFQITEPRKRGISYGIAAVVTVFGLYYYVSSGMRGFQMRRRIAEIQKQQQVNLGEIQKRLQDNQPTKGVPPSEAFPPAPAVKR